MNTCKSILVGVLLFVAVTANAAKPPSWLQDSLDRPLSKDQSEADAVVLLDEAEYDYNEAGVVKSTTRWAVKIFDKSERSQAEVSIGFEEGHSKVTGFKAWFIDPKGKVHRYDIKDTWDIASNGSSLHSDRLNKIFDMSDSVRDGCVFAVEYSVRKKTVFSQLRWFLEQKLPVAISRIKVSPPKNWDAHATFLNNAKVDHRMDGDTYIWEARDLAGISTEQGGPAWSELQARIGIDLRPRKKLDGGRLRAFWSWNDVASHDADVNDAQIVPNQAIQEKASELVEGKADLWSKLEAIGTFAQSVNYVSIETNLSLGGGYKPFQASEVLDRHFGDCKDKTALTRSLLKCIGIESFAVSADIGRGAHVDPSWPSLHQFNHCIVAISVDESLDCDAIVDDPNNGRLLIFDPTSQLTPFGKLPRGMDGSEILIGSSATVGLTKLSPMPPEANKVSRSITLELDDFGGVKGSLKEVSDGGQAILERGNYKRRSESEYRDLLVQWLSDNVGSAQLQDYSFSDNFQSNQTALDLSFDMPSFARSMRNKYLVFKPIVLGKNELLSVKVDDRKTAYRFRPRFVEDVVEVKIPEGFSVDDFAALEIVESDFGRFELSIEEKEGVLLCKRSYFFHEVEAPVERYQEVVDFYEKMVRAEQTPVVLVRSI